MYILFENEKLYDCIYEILVVYILLIFIIICDLFGLRKLINVFGFLILVRGIVGVYGFFVVGL